jgi:sterol 3beta-glucosyltransferase
MAFMAPRGQRALGRSVVAAVRDVPADILLLSPLAESAGHQLAEVKQIPSIGVRLQPLSMTAAYPPVALGPPSLGGVGNRIAGRLSTATLDRVYNHAVADLRADLDLPKLSARRLRRRRTEDRGPILYGYSPTVVPRPAD